MSVLKKSYNNNYLKCVKNVNEAHDKSLDDLHMFDLPYWLHDTENVEVFMDIFGDCIGAYKPSLPTKKSLSKAFRIVYQKNRATRSPEEEKIINTYYCVEGGTRKDAVLEYLRGGIRIPSEKLENKNIETKNLVIFVEYMLRHPELLVAAQKIYELKKRIVII